MSPTTTLLGEPSPHGPMCRQGAASLAEVSTRPDRRLRPWRGLRARLGSAVEDDRIVEADAPGLDRPLVGLSLLEAAAVPGETLAADALANAIARVFTPRPSRDGLRCDERRCRQRGRAPARRAERDRRHAAPLARPAGPSSERACCSPDAVIAARETCHRLGLPHVTLDLREEFRATVVRPFVEGYAQGLTPNPCMRCNGTFRFDALVDFTARAGADVSGRATTPGSSSATGCG